MTNNIDDLHDIYRALPERAEDSDYPVKIPPELEQQLHHCRVLSTLLGLFCVILLLLFTTFLTRETRIKPPIFPITPVEETRYVPHYTLPSDALWVMSYQQTLNEGGLEKEEEPGDNPVSSKWVKNAAYHVIIGQQALAVKKYDKAQVHLEKALMIFPGIHGVRGSLGTVYLKQHRFETAIEQFEQALQEDEAFSAISNLGVALLAAERFEEAEGYLLQAQTLQPEHPGCHKNLALLYKKMELPEKAIDHFETYFSLYREDFPAIELYVDYLLRLGQRERAAGFLRETCQQESEHALSLYLLLAKTEARATNDVQAVEALKNITRYISPNLALTKMNMEDFDTIRDTEAFHDLLHQLELALVTLENRN